MRRVVALAATIGLLILTGGPQAAPLSLGEQRILAFAINYSDNPTYRPWDLARLNTTLFVTYDAWLRAASYGQTWATGIVHQTYITIPKPQSQCSLLTDMQTGKTIAASAHGLTPLDFRRFVLLLAAPLCPQRPSPAFALADTVVSTRDDLGTLRHEFGHTMGLAHAAGEARDYTGRSINSYGDGFDPMGGGSGFHGASNAERLFWANTPATPYQTVTASGVYHLAPYEVAAGQVIALKIKVAGTLGTYYYVEARTTGGVMIRDPAGSSDPSGTNTLLLDLDPVTATIDRRLDVGQSYEIPERGLRFTTRSVDATGATVQIEVFPRTARAATVADVAVRPVQ